MEVPVPVQSPYDYTVYTTEAGRILIAKAIAERVPIAFTHAKVGNGRLPDGQSFAGMTDIVSPIEGALVLLAEGSHEGVIAKTTVQIRNQSAEEGFDITEIGVYAQDGGASVLFSYVTIYVRPFPIPPPKYGFVFEPVVLLTVSDAPYVEIIVDFNALLTAARAIALFWRRDEIIPKESIEGQIRQDDDIALLFGLLTNSIPGSTSFVISFDGLESLEILDGVLDIPGRRIWA